MNVLTFSHIGPAHALLSLPSPPMNNRYYRHIVMGKRAVTLLSSEARTFKKVAANYCLSNGIKPLDGRLALHLDWYRPRKVGDADAPLKAVLDALQGFAYHDDKQIEELHVRRFDDKNRPRVEVAVCAIRSA